MQNDRQKLIKMTWEFTSLTHLSCSSLSTCWDVSASKVSTLRWTFAVTEYPLISTLVINIATSWHTASNSAQPEKHRSFKHHSVKINYNSTSSKKTKAGQISACISTINVSALSSISYQLKKWTFTVHSFVVLWSNLGIKLNGIQNYDSTWNVVTIITPGRPCNCGMERLSFRDGP